MPKTETILAIEDWCRLHKKAISPARIITEVSKVLNIEVAIILQPGRGREDIAEAKHCCVWYMRCFGYTLQQVTVAMNREDHTNILKSQGRANAHLDANDSQFTEKILMIYDQLKQLL